jgi:hypothetical protein
MATAQELAHEASLLAPDTDDGSGTLFIIARDALMTDPAATAADVIQIAREAAADAALERVGLEHEHESKQMRCECGEATGEQCEWTGPLSETVAIEWMPEFLRDAHQAAGNSGVYPHNGALRLRVERSCARRLAEG